MGKDKGKIALAVFTSAAIGTAIGVGVGMLFAPRKGSKTRKKIRHTAVGTAYDVSKWLKHSKDEIAQAAHDTKEAFQDKMEDALSAMSHKGEDIIANLEDRMEEIKNKNA